MKFIDFLSETIEMNANDIDYNMPLSAIADSLAYLKIVAELDESFRIEIPISKAMDIKTVEDLYELTKSVFER